MAAAAKPAVGGIEAATVEVDEVHHRYGGSSGDDVLVDVTLRIDAGGMVALLGPSGCGKTTLLRAIAGLERPHRGTIAVGGREVAGPSTWVSAERRRVGMVFQDWALFPHLSVAGNIGYGLERKQRPERVRSGLELVGLAGFEDRMTSTLSGGQQQRVALARALAPRPDVLLLDEPFSNLDTALRSEVRAEVHRLLVDLGITAVFVTHDQEEAFVLGDEVAVMRNGRIEQVGDPHSLYTEPTSRWVAEFVGDASMLTATGSGDSVATPFGPVPLVSAVDGPADVLFRPEQLSLVDARDTRPEAGGTVELVEYYGHDAMVTVRLDGDSVRVRTAPDPGVRRGDVVGVAFTGRAVRAFPVQD